MSTSPLHEESTSPGAFAPNRHLDDSVLQTAEEAVLTNPASSAEALSPGAFDPGATPGDADDTLPRHPAYLRYQEELAAYVAQKPARAALIALATGAALAALVRAVLSRGRH